MLKGEACLSHDQLSWAAMELAAWGFGLAFGHGCGGGLGS